MQGKVYIPWYKAANNRFEGEETRFDVDRSGNAFLLTVYMAINKKGEPVEDIIRVKHLGKVTKEMLDEYLKVQQLPVHRREVDIHNVNQESLGKIIDFLKSKA